MDFSYLQYTQQAPARLAVMTFFHGGVMEPGHVYAVVNGGEKRCACGQCPQGRVYIVHVPGVEPLVAVMDRVCLIAN